MKYKFEKNPFVRKSTNYEKENFEEIDKISRREGVSFDVAINGLLRVATKEYWEEREAKKKSKGIKTSTRRSKSVLKPGTSYCQYIKCPKKGQSFLTKNMIKYDGSVLCSDKCVKGYKRD